MPTKRQPFLSLPRFSRATALLVVLAAPPAFSYQIVTPFWTSTINRALNLRDAYYKTILPDPANYSLIALGGVQRSELCDRLASSLPDTSNPWYHFVRGILACGEGDSPSLNHFTAALALSQTDPGTTWALFVEFSRNSQNVWAERCLMQLEKLLLVSGARAAPVIAQQLLFYAAAGEKRKEYSNASSYYAWADRFDPNQLWSLPHRLRSYIPSHPRLFASTLTAGIHSLRHSWPLQLAVAAHCFTWLNYFCTAVMLIIFAGVGLRHLPKAIHPISDRLPDTIPPSLTTLLPAAAVLSFLSLGHLPFLWFLAFCIWRFLERKEKALMVSAIALLVCTPLLARVEDMFIQARLPHGSLSLFLRASEEGYSSEIHRLTLEKALLDRTDAHAQLAASICAMKKGDTAASRQNSRTAMELRPDDPVILTAAGNAAYLSKDWENATRRYQDVCAKYPNNAQARFNLAQCFSQISGLATDLDFVKLLPPEEQARLNDYIAINNLYFSSNWPMLRQVIAPNYRPSYFWTSVFPKSIGSWKSTKILWGASFFGIPPGASFAVFLALFILLIGLHFTSAARKRKQRISVCRLCGRVLCDSCKKGELCPTCHQATRFIRNVKILAGVQSKIKLTRRRMLELAEHALDLCAPGAGMLFARRYPFRLVIPLILFTGVFYATYLFVSNIRLDYPDWTTFGIAGKAPYPLLVYNGVFLIRALLAVSRKKGTALA